MCTTSARLVTRRLRADPSDFDVQPSQLLDLTALGLTREQCEEALQWVDIDGSVASGHEAVAAMLGRAHRPVRPLGRLLTAPGLTRLAAIAYAWVARNRHIFPGGTAACAMPPAPRSQGGST